MVRLDCLQSRLEDMPALHGELPPEPLAALAATSVFAAAADGGSGKVMGMARRSGTHCSGQETPPTRGRVCRCNGACPRACVSRVSLFERGHTAGIVHDALVTSRLAGQ